MKRLGVAVFIIFLALGAAEVESGSPSPPLPLDPPAASKTRLPRLLGTVDSGTNASRNWPGSTVTLTTTYPEAEEYIALYPANPNNSVAVISDFSLRGGANTTKYAVSFNNGAAGTWFENFVPLVNQMPATSDGKLWEYNSSPVVAIDKQGYVYVSSLYFNLNDQANGIYVCVGRLTSPNLGFTVATAMPVSTNAVPSVGYSEDKPWLAVDNSDAASSGNVCVSWTRFFDTAEGQRSSVLFSRSLNHGAAWSAPVRVSSVQQDGAVQGSQVAIGPRGEVYVVYEVFYRDLKRQQFLAKSVDGGLSFSPAIPITPVFNEVTFPSTYRKNSFASMAVSPVNGFIYVVYADEPGAITGSEVEFIESRDGGATFSAPAPVNKPAKGHQFMPALTVDNTGVLHVSWFDTRNCSLGTSWYDVYATSRRNELSLFAPNVRVTAASIDAGTASFIGDYGGIAASGGFAHPVWTSGGFNNGLLQTATLQ